jgi:hypothetical protein
VAEAAGDLVGDGVGVGGAADGVGVDEAVAAGVAMGEATAVEVGDGATAEAVRFRSWRPGVHWAVCSACASPIMKRTVAPGVPQPGLSSAGRTMM